MKESKMEEYLPKISTKLSWQLRHNKENLKYKKEGANIWDGYVPTSILIKELDITFDDLKKIVETDSKNRYSFSDDETELRANQGHSIEVDLELKSFVPPSKLYHGTNIEVKNLILQTGIKSMLRNYVHLSEDLETAKVVALRRKKEIVIFELNTEEMIKDGILFYKSLNNVWLTEFVDSKYLKELLILN